jgi:gliding motility-associated protein GldL
MSKEGGFKEKFYGDIAPVITGLGAAIVILGALFKIQHYPGASLMLIVGLGTEAALFVMFAFAPKEAHYDWEKVYPQLAEEYDSYDDEDGEQGALGADNSGLVKNLGDMMADANINEDVISKLGSSFTSLNDTVGKIGDLSSAASASSDYAKNANEASKQLQAVGTAYKTTAEAMSGMAGAATDAKAYHAEVQNITKNLGSLNAVYEMELTDANNHIKAMNKFYGNLSSAMENMTDASKDTQKMKVEISKLTANLTQMNTVYGNMLTAMKG